MIIRLEFKGRIIHEINSSELEGEISIGRSHTCTWQVPKEESICSSKHAVLSRKGSQVWLHDLGSTNGTFHNGKRIQKKRLVLGDKFTLGNCVLSVEAKRGVEGQALSELLVQSGKERGKRKQLKPPNFTIGSDPTSNLCFLDMLVSRKHAEITIKEDGSCWMRDLGSKNGTSVNGMPLRDDKERLLKDGDRIAFSHFEVVFHDGSIRHSNKQVWLRLVILAATLLLGFGVYNTWQRLRPSAESFIKSARALAAREEFEQAGVAVEQAAVARHASANQVTIEELRRLLGVWQGTVSVWQRAQKALAASDWTQVSRDLGLLQTSKKEAWEWNEQAAVERENMAHAKAMLDACLRSQASFEREDLQHGELSADNQSVKEALAQLGAKTPTYLEPLKGELDKVARRQQAMLDEGNRLEAALNQLRESAPDYAKIVAVLEGVGGSQEAIIKHRAETLTPPLKALAASARALEEAVERVWQLDLQAAQSVDIKLPAQDVCAIEPRLSHARQTLEQKVAHFKSQGGQCMAMFGEIAKRIGSAGVEPECLRVLGDEAVMAQVFACDSIAEKLPKRGRDEPSGSYDRVLGVEEFYTWLSAYPEVADPAMLSDLPFVSVLSQARDVVQRMEAFLEFVGKPENNWLAQGKVAEQMARFKQILARRDELVRSLVERAEGDATRIGLLAGGMVARLSTKAGVVQIKGVKPEEWVAAELKALRAKLVRLNDQYSTVAPARQIEIREEILNSGIPGDSMVRRMWAFRDASAAVQK